MRAWRIAILSFFLTWPLSIARGEDAPPAADAPPEQAEFFEKKVRPLFLTRCAACHGLLTELLA
jgi:mono/diheme cytochrome c family protein